MNMIVRMWHGRVPAEKSGPIRGFAGEDIDLAKYYPEDRDFLLEFEPKVVHYEVVGRG
jgi:hypothetical protein